MNVMITGCAGFIGSHVTDLFVHSGYNVIGVDKFTYAGKPSNLDAVYHEKNFELFVRCVNETDSLKELIEEHDINWVIHLAAETHVDNSIVSSDVFMETNILGTKSVLDACREANVKLLHFSTDEVYGCPTTGSFVETDKLDPRNPYSASKAAAEHLITSYANTYGTEYIILRPSNNFGPRQHDEKFLPTILRKIKSGDKIPVYGDGMQEREWMYVKETAKAAKFVLENSEMNTVYNVSSNFHLKNIEVVNTVCDLIGVNPSDYIEHVQDRAGHDVKYSIDSTKLSDLGYNVTNDFLSNLKEIDDETFQTTQV